MIENKTFFSEEKDVIQGKVNNGQNKSVLQRFLDDSILSFELRNRIYRVSQEYFTTKKDSFAISEVFDSFFLDLELLDKTTVVADRSHSKFH